MSASQQDLVSGFRQLLQSLQQQRYRQLIWLSGEVHWCRAQALALLSELPVAHQDGCWLHAAADETLQQLDLPADFACRAAQGSIALLGSEQAVLVVDAFTGLHPDALGALAGRIKAGGILLLLTPEPWASLPDPDYRRLAAWPHGIGDLSRHFLQRLERQLQDAEVPRISQQQGLMGQWTVAAPGELAADSGLSEQGTLVTALQQWFAHRSPRPVVVTAARGRGKTSALGLLVRALLKQQPSLSILITAPAAAAVQAFWERLADLPAEQRQHLRFIAPDTLLQEQPAADLLLVDEAAALPVPMLQQLLAVYPRSVFATTQQGYEGNGRGFALRFTQHLNQQAPGWQAFSLSQPLRWASGDPLEHLINRLLMLDADVTDPQLPVDSLRVDWLDVAQLVANEALLRQVFGLLVLAHYRTTPDDFRQLLDGPGLRLACAWQGDVPVGLALIQSEGGFDAELAEAIFMGQRRPQGHLLAQSLAFHGGFVQAARLRIWRIQRILVHPRLQRQGIGRLLLDFVRRQARKAEVSPDLLGSSFGATASLLPFWFSAGYRPVRVGLTRDQASGEHTLQVVQGLSPAGRQLTRQLHQRLAATLPDLLATALRDLPVDLVLVLLRHLPLRRSRLSEQDQRELLAYAAGHRPLALSHTALRRWFWRQLAAGQPDAALKPWVALLLQHRPPEQLDLSVARQGHRELDRWLRSQFRTLPE